MTCDDRYLEYIELFNDRQFYECHEVLEDLWLDDLHHPSRRFYQGLIHLATAYQHLFRGNMPGCAQRFASALVYFQDYPDHYEGLSLSEIRSNVAVWQGRIVNSAAAAQYLDCDVPKLRLQ